MRNLLASTTIICSLAAGGVLAQDAPQTDTSADPTLQQTAPAASDDATSTDQMESTDTAASDESSDDLNPDADTDTAATDDAATGDMTATDTAESDTATEEMTTDTAAAGEAMDEEGTEEVASAEGVVREQSQNELRLDWINGATVVSPDGETIGDVNDVIFDGETGELTAAILSVGGFLGIGSKQIAVDWDQITIDNDANTLTSNLTREEAEAAPEYAFRDQEQPPAPAMDTGTGMGTSTGTGMGSGTTQLN